MKKVLFTVFVLLVSIGCLFAAEPTGQSLGNATVTLTIPSGGVAYVTAGFTTTDPSSNSVDNLPADTESSVDFSIPTDGVSEATVSDNLYVWYLIRSSKNLTISIAQDAETLFKGQDASSIKWESYLDDAGVADNKITTSGKGVVEYNADKGGGIETKFGYKPITGIKTTNFAQQTSLTPGDIYTGTLKLSVNVAD